MVVMESMMMSDVIAQLQDIAQDAKAWPFAEAVLWPPVWKKLAPKIRCFETGYGPSGLPHIGTFGEVVAPRWFGMPMKPHWPTQNWCVFLMIWTGSEKCQPISPIRKCMANYIDMPLTKVPDPFGTAPSYGMHNNLRLQAFLDGFGFDYEFKSSTECYTNGDFDTTLIRVLEHYDAIMAIMLPTLGLERQATYSPFFPICPDTGRVLQAKVVGQNPAAGTISYIDPATGDIATPRSPAANVNYRKCDWAMRWRLALIMK